MSAGFLFDRLVEDAGAMVERGIVTRETLLKRAKWLKEDLDALAWEGFHILPKQWIHPPQTGLYHPLVEYKWGQTDHNIDKSDGDAFKHASSALAIDGTGLDLSLIHLRRCRRTVRFTSRGIPFPSTLHYPHSVFFILSLHHTL